MPLKFVHNIVDKLRCPACHSDELEIVSLTLHKKLPQGEITCDNCLRSYEIIDGIIDLVSDLPRDLVREDTAHERESKYILEHGTRDEVYLLGLPDSHIEKQISKRNRNYASQVRPLFNQMKDALCLTQGDEILEIGAGVTWATRYLAKERYECTALDLNTYMFRGLKSAHVYFSYESVYYQLIRGLMENLPFKNEAYNKIFSIAALHHSSNLPKTFSEIRRVLKSNGRAVIVDSTSGWWTRISQRKHIEEMREKWGLNDHQVSINEWLQATSEAGFQQTEIQLPNYLMDKLRRISGRDPSKLKPLLKFMLPFYHIIKGTGLVLIVEKPKQ